MSIFKDCDIRGVYGSDLDDSVAYHVGRAVASRSPGQRIVVGGDLRPSTSALKSALIKGLVESGGHVIDLNTIPTPALYYGRKLLQAEGGIMVTASHNPARYNGFKLTFGDLPITPDDLQDLRERMEAQDYRAERGSCVQARVLEPYIASFGNSFAHLTPHRVVVDAGNGSLWSVAPTVLETVGQVVERLYCTPDGTFPYRDPNPAVPEHLGDLSQRVLASSAELGVAYDGDGDRVIFVDQSGRVQPADRVLVLFARHMLRGAPGGAVVYDLKCSSIVAEEVQASGGRALMEKSGHAFIKRRLLVEGAILGGEISGHYFFGALGGDDPIYATLLMLNVLDVLGLGLREAMDTVPVYPSTPDIRIPCPREQAQAILGELQRAFSDYPINTLDGVRIQFSAGWALARISVTEPLITLRFEAHSVEELEEIKRSVRCRSPLLDELVRTSRARF